MTTIATLPLHTESENEKRRGNWRVSHAKGKREKQAVGLVLNASSLTLTPLVTVTLTRISAGTLDDDNLRGALKNVRDAVASWLRVDDGSELIRFVYEQEKGPKGEPGVRIGISFVGDGSEGA